MEIQTSSIFNMTHVNEIMTMSYGEAVKHARSIVQNNKHAKATTKNKAFLMIQKSRSPHALAYAMSSWILAHPTEGLKVIK